MKRRGGNPARPGAAPGAGVVAAVAAGVAAAAAAAGRALSRALRQRPMSCRKRFRQPLRTPGLLEPPSPQGSNRASPQRTMATNRKRAAALGGDPTAVAERPTPRATSGPGIPNWSKRSTRMFPPSPARRRRMTHGGGPDGRDCRRHQTMPRRWNTPAPTDPTCHGEGGNDALFAHAAGCVAMRL